MAAVEAGADAVGLVFYAASPRAISVSQAINVCAQLPPFISIVALTVNAEKTLIEEIVRALPSCILQFHGDESPRHCEAFKRPYIKALRMRPGVDVKAELDRYASAQALLLDAYQKGAPGGTGEIFDWDIIPKAAGERIILAGGLSPCNIGDAIRIAKPYAVDVSSGVEAEPGIKDVLKINEFVGKVIRAGIVE